FSDQLDEPFSGLIHELASLAGNVDLFGISVAAELVSFHVDHVDNSAKVFLFANRQSERNDGPAKDLLGTLDRPAKVGVLFINFTPTWCCAGDVEKRTDQLRLPCVAMSNDGKITNKLCSVGLHI